MGLSAQYSSEVRKHLSYFPVWEPGQRCSPGDVGRLVDGVFMREASLDQIFPSLEVKLARASDANVRIFHSGESVSVKSKVQGKVPQVGALAKAEGTVEISFARQGAVVFHAAQCKTHSIDNLDTVRQYIGRYREKWSRSHVLVSHVDSAEKFAVFVSSAAGGSLSLKGKLDFLNQFKLADAGVSVVASHSIGYQGLGKGPVLARLYGFSFLGREMKPQGFGIEGAEGSEPRFEEISARDPAHES